MKRIILFEDGGHADFDPLTHLRPVFHLRCGAFSLHERIRALAGSKVPIGCWVLKKREQVLRAGARLEPADIRRVGSGPALIVNGRALLTAGMWSQIMKAPANTAFICDRELVAAKIQDVLLHSLPSDEPDQEALSALATLCRPAQLKEGLARHLWDYVNANCRMIEDDAKRFNDSGARLGPGAFLLGKRGQLKLGRGAAVEPGVVLDVRQGPIVIDSQARIRGPSLIEGPCCLGPESLVDGARLRPGVSLGRCCKAAGEIEESIILDFTNKHHDGFLGHSYLGSWVNIGAQTCNSDLKNNYGPVRVQVAGRSVDSGCTKVGCFIGDHTKTAIGTLINTGAVIGIGCSVFGGPVRKGLPPFTWGCSDRPLEHKADKMLETAAAVMKRRRQALTPEMRQLIAKVYQETAGERRNSIKGEERT